MSGEDLVVCQDGPGRTVTHARRFTCEVCGPEATKASDRLLAAERLAAASEEVYSRIPCECDGDVWPCASCALRDALSAWKEASK